jgi:hypothetical protein
VIVTVLGEVEFEGISHAGSVLFSNLASVGTIKTAHRRRSVWQFRVLARGNLRTCTEPQTQLSLPRSALRRSRYVTARVRSLQSETTCFPRSRPPLAIHSPNGGLPRSNLRRLLPSLADVAFTPLPRLRAEHIRAVGIWKIYPYLQLPRPVIKGIAAP